MAVPESVQPDADQLRIVYLARNLDCPFRALIGFRHDFGAQLPIDLLPERMERVGREEASDGLLIGGLLEKPASILRTRGDGRVEAAASHAITSVLSRLSASSVMQLLQPTSRETPGSLPPIRQPLGSTRLRWWSGA